MSRGTLVWSGLLWFGPDCSGLLRFSPAGTVRISVAKALIAVDRVGVRGAKGLNRGGGGGGAAPLTPRQTHDTRTNA